MRDVPDHPVEQSQNETTSLMERVKQLEGENAMLKSRLGIRPRKNMWPKSIMSKYELVFQSVKAARDSWGDAKKFPLEFEQQLSRVIRCAVFGDTAKKTKKGYKQVIATIDMTDADFEIYLYVLDRVLAAFEEGLKKRKGAEP
ncbi:MAG: hypothetical protein J5633_10105 [Oscillospiraceae bacterium]|nr:hypothetical protein [Oscillospiraceae bacterium]